MPKRCPKCGGLMVLKTINGKKQYVCLRCGHTEPASGPMLKKSSKNDNAAIFVIKEDDIRKYASKTELVSCPRCGHTPVLYYERQTRSADEPPTRFYKCPKCGYTRREYRVSLFLRPHISHVVRGREALHHAPRHREGNHLRNNTRGYGRRWL